MSLYVISKQNIITPLLFLGSYPIPPDNVFSREDNFLKVSDKYLSLNDGEFFLSLNKEDAIPITITEDHYIRINGLYLDYDYNERKLILSNNKDIIFVRNLSELYIHNKIAFILNGIDEEDIVLYQDQVYEFLTNLGAIGNLNLNLKTKTIENLILVGHSDLHQSLKYGGKTFEWWFESLKNAKLETIYPDTFSKTETLSLVHKCKDPLLLEQLLSGMRDPFFENEYGESALMIAIKENLTNTANYLLRTSINFNHVSKNGNNALNYAVKYKNFNAVSKIYRNHEIKDWKKNIKLAVETNNYKIVKLIFNRYILEHEEIDEDLMNYVLEKSNPLIANLFIKYVDEIQDLETFLDIDEDDYETEEEAIPLIPSNMYNKDLIFVCVFNNLNIILKHLIENGIDINVSFRGYGIERFVTDFSLVIPIIEAKTGLKIEKEIPLYSEKNFRLVKKISEGTFGEITLEKNNIDNKEYVIKRSKDCKGKNIYDTTLSNEIIIMQKINELFPDLTSKLYGLMLSDSKNCISVVLEESGIRFYEYLTSLSEQKRKEEFKDFFKSLLTSLKQLQSLGIIHDDLHMNNVLVKNGNPVIIDYGICSFQEVFPFEENLFSLGDRPWIPVHNYTKKIFTNISLQNI